MLGHKVFDFVSFTGTNEQGSVGCAALATDPDHRV
jgi:hypothetical protein